MRVRVRVSEKGERIKNKKRGDPKAGRPLLEIQGVKKYTKLSSAIKVLTRVFFKK